jgi:RNA-directed DNA polymerase
MSSSQSDRFRKYEFNRFGYVLGFNRKLIQHVIENIDANYTEWTKNKTDKLTGKLKTYMDGTIKTRTFRDPSRILKAIQGRIKERILAPIRLPNTIHGGIKKRSNITNAKEHQGNKYVFTTDLRDFYPSISPQRVYDTLIELKFSPHFSHWLTCLTTLKGELPQGTPTSTHLANLVFLKTDLRLIQLCNEHGIKYTRYVDDLTFSAQQDFRDILNQILNIVTYNGFLLNYRKTKYSGNQTITGIKVFLNKIDAPDLIIEKAKIEERAERAHKPTLNYLNSIRRTNKKSNKLSSQKL